MPQPQVYLDGQFVSPDEARIPLDDLGFMLGATVTEQLRSFGGRLFHVDEHLARLARSLAIVGLSDGVDLKSLSTAAVQLASTNHALLDPADDLSLSIFVTPGTSPALANGRPVRPRVCMHTFPLTFGQWAEKYSVGEQLVVTQVQQVSTPCWPSELKCRSRMHYYLADREARERQPGARALLPDAEGRITEATTANALLYEKDSGILVPPAARVLPGISLAMVRWLAQRRGIAWHERELTAADVAAADEVMLSSTPFCLLPVTGLDGKPIGPGQPGPLFQSLLADWSVEVGVDIAGQAKRFAQR
ncbi:MAG: aminotransferase class IV [Planctomycetes bacterium]|nr:aminotransferase class IV [Planctomycetota bacterium]